MLLVLDEDHPSLHHIKYSTIFGYYYGRESCVPMIHNTLDKALKLWDYLPEGYIPVSHVYRHTSTCIVYPVLLNGATMADFHLVKTLIRRRNNGLVNLSSSSYETVTDTDAVNVAGGIFAGSLVMTTRYAEEDGVIQDDQLLTAEDVSNESSHCDFVSLKTKFERQVLRLAEGDQSLLNMIDKDIDELMFKVLKIRTEKSRKGQPLPSISTIVSMWPETDNSRKRIRKGF